MKNFLLFVTTLLLIFTIYDNHSLIKKDEKKDAFIIKAVEYINENTGETLKMRGQMKSVSEAMNNMTLYFIIGDQSKPYKYRKGWVEEEEKPKIFFTALQSS